AARTAKAGAAAHAPARRGHLARGRTAPVPAVRAHDSEPSGATPDADPSEARGAPDTRVTPEPDTARRQACDAGAGRGAFDGSRRPGTPETGRADLRHQPQGTRPRSPHAD